MTKKCCICGCYSKNQSYHEIPAQNLKRDAWFNVLKHITDITNITDRTVVCDSHFKIEDYSTTTSSRKRLKPGAVPSIFMVLTNQAKELNDTQAKELNNTSRVSTREEVMEADINQAEELNNTQAKELSNTLRVSTREEVMEADITWEFQRWDHDYCRPAKIESPPVESVCRKYDHTKMTQTYCEMKNVSTLTEKCSSFSYKALIVDSKMFQFFVGLTVNEFDAFLEMLDLHLMHHRDKCGVRDKIILILIRIKRGYTFEEMDRFGDLSAGCLQATFTKYINFLYYKLFGTVLKINYNEISNKVQSKKVLELLEEAIFDTKNSSS